jgi:hypothetical protein
MKKHSIIMTITCLVGMVTSLVGLWTIATNNEQIALLTYLFLAFAISGTIILVCHKEFDRTLSK